MRKWSAIKKTMASLRRRRVTTKPPTERSMFYTGKCFFCNGQVNRRQRWCSPRCRRLRLVYGLTASALADMLLAQCSKCAICEGNIAQLAQQHIYKDPRTGRPRGVLCSRCKMGIGMFAGSPERLQAAATYLSKGNKKGCDTTK